jgi:hypothetical protein
MQLARHRRAAEKAARLTVGARLCGKYRGDGLCAMADAYVRQVGMIAIPPALIVSSTALQSTLRIAGSILSSVRPPRGCAMSMARLRSFFA